METIKMTKCGAKIIIEGYKISIVKGDASMVIRRWGAAEYSYGWCIGTKDESGKACNNLIIGILEDMNHDAWKIHPSTSKTIKRLVANLPTERELYVP
jgi:hypothetical protein